MLSPSLRLAILFALVIYFIILGILLKKQKLALRYTLLWIASGLIMLILLIFPQLLNAVTSILGIEVQSNALFAILFFCILMILMSITVVISKQNESIKKLTQYTAILEKRIRELEDDG